MVKRITAILLFILLFEVVGLFAFFRHARQVVFALRGADGDNTPGREFLDRPLPKSLKLESAEHSWILNEKTVPSWQAAGLVSVPYKPSSSLEGYFYDRVGLRPALTKTNNSAKLVGLVIDEKELGEFLLEVAASINQDPRDAELVIENGRANKFTPHQPGKILDLKTTRQLIVSALATGGQSVPLPIHFYAPNVVLGDLNNLGVEELLARGQTDFTGSSASRIQNIRVGASQYNGLIIPRGEEFSFNSHLGPIDAAHGYLPELVIKPEGTVPEFGGGLCQVSSTAFRAAFFTGLPITRRRNHSYAVKYYEWISDDEPRTPGLDATIYPGAQDLKFVNDTPGAILVATHIEGKRLYFDFYGTADGREVVMDAPETYDRKPSGAVKVKVVRKILKPGAEPMETVFVSNYVSPNLYPRVYEYPKTVSVGQPGTINPVEPPPPVNN